MGLLRGFFGRLRHCDWTAGKLAKPDVRVRDCQLRISERSWLANAVSTGAWSWLIPNKPGFGDEPHPTAAGPAIWEQCARGNWG